MTTKKTINNDMMCLLDSLGLLLNEYFRSVTKPVKEGMTRLPYVLVTAVAAKLTLDTNSGL